MDFVNKAPGEVIAWLEGRLKSEDGWNSRHLAAYFQPDLVQHILTFYSQLEQHIRIKLMLAMLDLDREVLIKNHSDYKQLIQIGKQDEDDWVSRTASLVEYLVLDTDVTINMGDMVEGFDGIAKKLRNKDLYKNIKPGCKPVLPKELSFLNYSVLSAIGLNQEFYTPQTAPEGGHFRLKKQLKTSAIKAEILAKSKDIKDEEINTVTPLSNATPYTNKNTNLFLPSSSKVRTHSLSSRPYNIKSATPSFVLKGSQAKAPRTKLITAEDLPVVTPTTQGSKRKKKEAPPSHQTPIKKEQSQPVQQLDITPEANINQLKRKKLQAKTSESVPPSLDISTAAPLTAEAVSPTISHMKSQKKRPKMSEKKKKFMEEMFAEANLLTGEQKQLIMDFMVGHAENPYPDYEDKITFTLNKVINEQQIETELGGLQIQTSEVETLFEMDYSTQQWRKLKKSVILKPTPRTLDNTT